MDLIKIYFSYIALCFLFALLLFFGALLVIALVYLIRVFCEWCFNFFFNREDDNEQV